MINMYINNCISSLAASFTFALPLTMLLLPDWGNDSIKCPPLEHKVLSLYPKPHKKLGVPGRWFVYSVKMLTAKPDNLNLIPRAHIVENKMTPATDYTCCGTHTSDRNLNKQTKKPGVMIYPVIPVLGIQGTACRS